MKQTILLFIACFFLISNTIMGKEVKTLPKNDSFLFEENKGQMKDMNGNLVPHVLFKMQTSGVDLYITDTGLTYVFYEMISEEIPGTGSPLLAEMEKTIRYSYDWERVDVMLSKASIKRENIRKENELQQGKLNFFLGHCPEGIRNVSQYGKIIIKDIYPNIDWVLYNSSNQGFKYDFILHPGARIEDISLIYRSKMPLEMENGAIQISTRHGLLIESKPVSFLNGEKINSSFVLSSNKANPYGGYDSQIIFAISSEIQNKLSAESLKNELVIDPELMWSTFYGGVNNDGASCIKTDAYNNLYIGGLNQSVDFPLANISGYFQGTNNGSLDGIILKFNAEGERLWSTLYGGGGIDQFYGLDIDKDNNVYLAGYTQSYNFPIQDIGTFHQSTLSGASDGTLVKFNSSGDRLWATYIGGNDQDEIYSIATYTDGVYVAGYTYSTDFHIQDQGTFLQSTIGGGMDATIQKFDSDGNLQWSTYYGGSNTESSGTIIVDNVEDVYITGYTISSDFHVLDGGGYFDSGLTGLIDAYLLKFDPDGNLLRSTLYGGSGKEMGQDLAVDEFNNLFLYGYTNSNDLPLLDAGTYFQDHNPVYPNDSHALPFILKFTAAGERLWATYYGNDHAYSWKEQHNLAVDDCNNLFLAMRDRYGVSDPHPFCEKGFTDVFTSYIQAGFLVKFSNEGDLMGATFISGTQNDGFDNLIATGNDNTLWYCMTLLGGGVVDNDSYPLVPGSSNAYFDNTFNGSSDFLIMKFHTDPKYFTDCECISTDLTFEVPNVFTPNGDNVNDVFQINSENAANIELKILNRWGNLIYTDSGPQVSWDGLSNTGQKVVDGVYFVYYDITDLYGQSFSGQRFLQVFGE